MRRGASGEEDVIQYMRSTKKKKKKTHSAHAARTSLVLISSAPRLEQQAQLRKRGKNGSKSGHVGVQQEQQQPFLRHKYNEED